MIESLRTNTDSWFMYEQEAAMEQEGMLCYNEWTVGMSNLIWKQENGLFLYF